MAHDAVVYFKSPETFRDLLKQRRRFLASPGVQASLFGHDVLREFEIPALYKLRAAGSAGVQAPFLTFGCFALWLFGRVDQAANGFKKSPVGWDMSRSTKVVSVAG